jgi:hypothetical protein
MKQDAVPVNKGEFEENCGPVDEHVDIYEQDPSFGYFKSMLNIGSYTYSVYYWRYAGFETIYKEVDNGNEV